MTRAEVKRADLAGVLTRSSQMRDGLLQLELRWGKQALHEDRAGNYELAALHRCNARLAKKVRMGCQPDDLFDDLTRLQHNTTRRKDT